MIENSADFIPGGYQDLVHEGSFEWEAPSNIALVKYWGKKANQIPANPSISFTLSHCKTVTKFRFKKIIATNNFSYQFLFEGNPKPDFHPKIEQFFKRIEIYLPFLKSYHFEIDSLNTFPHSSGIASSASAMAALALNLMSLERLLNPEMTDDFFYQKASFLARLGSGSACRSVKGNVVSWGKHPDLVQNSDLFGVPFEGLHPNFYHIQDTILLIDKGSKKVSSTLGHDLMHNHPFSDARFEQAFDHLMTMQQILTDGNWDAFCNLVESEALTLHAMMMTSNPYFILMKPNTLLAINAIWDFREKHQAKICFTLDAGANVHVLFAQEHQEIVSQFIKETLAPFCENNQYICDQLGNGAKQIFSN
uniref:diphosphomevalonate/mevalonate 3,5-bisphosphate decarboxylase family protein n=1 Tax=Flavobacterium sp. TaxID=239 RepID=UPI00404AB476